MAKVKVIFDTDIGSDCDDAGALAMLAADRAEQERFDDLYQAELIYIRKSEAEVQWEARNQK